jgi:WhiB family transcriptional regulator, redox-sensing transcriptional regulator
VTDWWIRAACRGADTELWYPTGPAGWAATSPTAQKKIAEDEVYPKGVCWKCPVQLQCLKWAVKHGEAGIWGGLNETERRSIKAGSPLWKVIAERQQAA